jgi:hypothetical protein
VTGEAQEALDAVNRNITEELIRLARQAAAFDVKPTHAFIDDQHPATRAWLERIPGSPWNKLLNEQACRNQRRRARRRAKGRSAWRS